MGYVIFLLGVTVAYWLLPRRIGRWWLFIASLLFYASWNALYLPGFLALILANFWIGLRVGGPNGRRWLIAGIALDAGMLGVFKYLDWVLGSTVSAVSLLTGRPLDFGGLGIVLPLAISFVTFTLIAYLVDTHRGRAPERRFVHFALFVTYFPHLIAGPIMRAREFLPQVHHPRPFRTAYLGVAAPLIISGLLKKTVADQLHPPVAAAFAAPERFSSAGLVVAAIAFTFQLYLDFAGYTDIALGSARLLGFRLPQNFDWPYRSTSMAEFWSRWHITLGRWLRDYIYFPLGGSREGNLRAYANLMLTMSLAGLWHGSGLTYIIWGALQGVALCVNRWWRNRARAFVLPTLLAWAMTFTFVVFVRVFFISDSLEQSFEFLTNLVAVHGGRSLPLWVTATVVIGILAQWTGWQRLFARLVPERSPQRWAAMGAAVLIIILFVPVVRPTFIYFQF